MAKVPPFTQELADVIKERIDVANQELLDGKITIAQYHQICADNSIFDKQANLYFFYDIGSNKFLAINPDTKEMYNVKIPTGGINGPGTVK